MVRKDGVWWGGEGCPECHLIAHSPRISKKRSLVACQLSHPLLEIVSGWILHHLVIEKCCVDDRFEHAHIRRGNKIRPEVVGGSTGCTPIVLWEAGIVNLYWVFGLADNCHGCVWWELLPRKKKHFRVV